MGRDDFSCSTGRKRPRSRQLAAASAGPGQPDPKRARQRGRPPREARLHGHHGREGGGKGFTSVHLLKCRWRLGGPERGAREASPTRRPAPQPVEDRKRTPRPRRRGRERRSRGKEPPAEQEESGANIRVLATRGWGLVIIGVIVRLSQSY